MKILVLGMKNPILSNKGIGLTLTQRLKKRIKGAKVAADVMIGVGLLEQIDGYDKIFIIDALNPPDGDVFELNIISDTDGHGSRYLYSYHGLNIFDLMELGKQCGYRVPDLVALYGIKMGSDLASDNGFARNLDDRIDDLEDAIVCDMVQREPLLQ